MKVKVCDAICGAGKTQSCIKMMNEEKDKKFIFITPYLKEVDRIKNDCKRNFKSPEANCSNGFSKLEDLNKLLDKGDNIASTHALFTYYTDETKELIKEKGYTLVLDEVMSVFQPAEVSNSDMNLLVKTKTIKVDNDKFIWDDEDYNDGFFSDIKSKSRSNNLVKYGNEMFFWSVPPELFKCFDDVYVLTYMFEFQLQKYFFDIYKIEYELIGTKKISDGVYEFCSLEEMNRRIDLRDKIHILEHEKLNEIGYEKGSLSLTWYKKSANNDETKLIKLKNNLTNLYKHIFQCKSNERMWSTFKNFKNDLRGRGYKNSFVPYNMRATNDFTDKKYLAYCLNVYLQTWAKNYLIEQGAKNVSDNMYAISTLIQWLFRSAIRKGEEVWLYLPSNRMRMLFKIWLDNLAEGRDLEIINLDMTRNKNKKYLMGKEKIIKKC